MIDHESAWLAHQRQRWMRPDAQRFMRPDAQRWIRPDVARFLIPGTNPADVFPALDRKYNPNQPRVPAGNSDGGQWTDGSDASSISFEAPGGGDAAASDADPAAGGPLAFQQVNSGSFESWTELLDRLAWKDPHPIPNADAADVGENLEEVGGGRRPPLSTWFPSASTEQLVRLDLANARTETALAGIRRYDEDWQPREQSFETRPGGVDGAIARAEARAAEAESYLDRLRFGVGGNFSPPLDPPRNQAPLSPVFDGSAWIRAYRTINNSPDLFGRGTGRKIGERLLLPG